MFAERNAPRWLGAAFLFVFFASLFSNVLLTSVAGSGNVSHDLLNLANQLTRLRLSILGQILTSSGIVVLAVLLYVVLSRVNRILALVAVGVVARRSHHARPHPVGGARADPAQP